MEKALGDSRLTDEQKRKLKLAQEARVFAEANLGLKHTDNYSTYVHLDRPYVTYVVTAAPRQELQTYKWWFPVVGSVPYKGFFNPEKAKLEAEAMRARGYDAFVRGVSAYSTLGWFSDPLLSSMLSYKDHDLVDTIIHETVHATIYIRGHAEFNERLAVFIGHKGAEEFYRAKEGAESPTLKLMVGENEDDKLFSDFMAKEIKALKEYYEKNREVKIPEEERQAHFGAIKARFVAEVRPRLKIADSYRGFENSEINNARLVNYSLYNDNMGDFERAFAKLGRDFKKMLEFCKSLEKADDPEVALKNGP